LKIGPTTSLQRYFDLHHGVPHWNLCLFIIFNCLLMWIFFTFSFENITVTSDCDLKNLKFEWNMEDMWLNLWKIENRNFHTYLLPKYRVQSPGYWGWLNGHGLRRSRVTGRTQLCVTDCRVPSTFRRGPPWNMSVHTTPVYMLQLVRGVQARMTITKKILIKVWNYYYYQQLETVKPFVPELKLESLQLL